MLGRNEPDVHALPVDQPLGGREELVVADDLLGSPNEVQRAIERRAGEAPDLLPREQVILIRPHIGDRPFSDALIFGRRETKTQGIDDLTREPLLNVEHILESAVELLRPQLCVGRNVHELGSDAEVETRAPNASGQDVSRAELAGDRRRVLVAPFEPHRGLSGDHAHGPDHREIGDQLVHETVGEQVAVRLGGDIRERQDGDRRHGG